MECGGQGEFSATARDHAEHPRCHGMPSSHNGHARVTGPCGDTMEFWVYAVRDQVLKVGFETDGCGSSLACGSMACTLAEGKPLLQAERISQQAILQALGGFPRESEHCALLAANTLRAACEDCRLHGSWRK